MSKSIPLIIVIMSLAIISAGLIFFKRDDYVNIENEFFDQITDVENGLGSSALVPNLVYFLDPNLFTFIYNYNDHELSIESKDNSKNKMIIPIIIPDEQLEKQILDELFKKWTKIEIDGNQSKLVPIEQECKTFAIVTTPIGPEDIFGEESIPEYSKVNITNFYCTNNSEADQFTIL